MEFRKNSISQNEENIRLVNEFGPRTMAAISSSAPLNVVERLRDAKIPMFWWNPLVDDPREPESLSAELYRINKLPCMNTGGNVGTAAWVLLSGFLGVPEIGIVGMDLGYYHETPYKLTQTYYELILHHGSEEGLDEYFQHMTFPLTGEKFYTDPTYFWYRKNILELFNLSQVKTFNCTEGGTLFGETVECTYLKDFLQRQCS